jgi:hypothetical protein
LEHSVPTIHVDRRNNAGDIAIYVQKCFQKPQALSRLSTSNRVEIEGALVEKSEGMFLWADMLLKELNKKPRASSMFEIFHKAPKGLNEAAKKWLVEPWDHYKSMHWSMYFMETVWIIVVLLEGGSI